MPATTIQRALLSVSDKTGILELAKALQQRGVEILSTGGTAKTLKAANIPVVDISDYTGFPEMMDGRVKTLNPKIHGGILGRRDIDHEVMVEHDIHDIDLVVVNLYPFQAVSQNPESSLEDCIENIDVGGPTMIRAAAKNYAWVTVLVDPHDYPKLLKALDDNHGCIDQSTRFQWAQKAFAHTAAYDGMIADYLGRFDDELKPQTYSKTFHLSLSLDRSLRYGENPQQSASFYKETTDNITTLSHAEQLQGKPLSFNNLVDAEAALMCCYQFAEPACVIVKHANPCGASVADSLLQAYEKAFACDPTSSFGGIIAFNQTVDGTLIQKVLGNQFVEVIIAPQFTQEALVEVQKKPNVRCLATGTNKMTFDHLVPDMKRVRGGLLVQDWDTVEITPEQCTVPTRLAPSNAQWDDLIFTWKICKYVKSNAIVLGKNRQTLGIGAGQMSRVFSMDIAQLKAKQEGLALNHCVLASDAFFPFKDSIEHAAHMGVKAIIQTGGSIRDNEVIQACDELGLSMILTHQRHFRH